jgi:hypothetical protein
MKITKFEHACLLIEAGERVAIFDPGEMSESVLDVGKLEQVDDIFITHDHHDHFSLKLVSAIHSKFPNVRITSTESVIKQLAEEHINASQNAPLEVTFFNSPHEGNLPFLKPPEQIGIHFLGQFSDPGDSLSFNETKPILALPITAPWGSTLAAVNLALQLKPKFIAPVHDWLWRDEVRKGMYGRLGQLFKDYGITFLKLETSMPMELEL